MTAVLFLLNDWAETFSCHSESINGKYWKRSGFHVIIWQEMTDVSEFGVQKSVLSELWLRSSFTGSPCYCTIHLSVLLLFNMAGFLSPSVSCFLFLCIYFPFSSLRPRTQLFPTECSAEGWAFVSCCRETWRRRRQAHFLAAKSGSMSVWEKAGETDLMMAE